MDTSKTMTNLSIEDSKEMLRLYLAVLEEIGRAHV